MDGGHSDKREQRRQRVFALLITGEPGHLCNQDTGTVSRWTVMKEYCKYAGLRTKNLTKLFETVGPRFHAPLYTKMFLVSICFILSFAPWTFRIDFNSSILCTDSCDL